MTFRIGVDVDGAVCASDIYWLKSLQRLTSKILSSEQYQYNLTIPFEEELQEKGMTGLEWWKAKDLYDDDKIPFYPEAKKTLWKWKEQGHDIIFISSIKGDHAKSKYQFLKRHFPVDGYVNTREKNLVDVDVMIDDYEKNLDLFLKDPRRYHTKLVLVPTMFNSARARLNETVDHWWKDFRDHRITEMVRGNYDGQ